MISLGNRLNVCMLFSEPQGFFFVYTERERDELVHTIFDNLSLWEVCDYIPLKAAAVGYSLIQDSFHRRH